VTIGTATGGDQGDEKEGFHGAVITPPPSRRPHVV
jgi:hypothetical protein